MSATSIMAAVGRRYLSSVLIGLTLLGAAPADAKAFKTNDLTLDVPSDFTVSKSARGLKIQSSDEEVSVWFETFKASELDKVIAEHAAYWNENDVVLNEPTVRDIGVPGGAKQEATDFKKATWEGKPTVVRYITLGPVGTETTVMLYTLWTTPEGLSEHGEAVLGILKSADLKFTPVAQAPAAPAPAPVAQAPVAPAPVAPAPVAPAPAPAPATAAPASTTQVEGWDVDQSPGSDGVCAIRYTKAKAQAGGAIPYLSVVYGFDPKVNAKFTALSLEFAGWTWTPGQIVQGATGANDGLLKLTDTSWKANNPTGLFIGATNADEVLALLRKFNNLTITDGTRATVFEYSKPDAALAALQPCIGEIKAAP